MIRSCCITIMISGTPNTMSKSGRSSIISHLKSLIISVSNVRLLDSSLNLAVSTLQYEPLVKPTRPGPSPPYQTPVNVSQSRGIFKINFLKTFCIRVSLCEPTHSSVPTQTEAGVELQLPPLSRPDCSLCLQCRLLLQQVREQLQPLEPQPHLPT